MTTKKFCYEVHADTPAGRKVTFPVADTDEEALETALAVFPRGSRVTKVVNQDTGKVWVP
jgi:hypothetical protein